VFEGERRVRNEPVRADFDLADFLGEFAGDHALAKSSPAASLGVMSAAQVLEQFHRLPIEGQHEVFDKLCDEFDDELSPEQVAELDRRAGRALRHPELCRPLDDVVADIEKRFRSR